MAFSQGPRILRLVALSALLGCGLLPANAQPPKWQATLPSVAAEPATWIALLGELREKGFHAGALAASARTLMFFTSLDAKEAAYKTILEVVDRGYPFPVLSHFQAGDLSPSGDYDFVNSYNLYKAVLNKEKGLEKWARHYLESVDVARYRKYLFLEALDAYARKDYATVEQKLKTLLAADAQEGLKPFFRKVARTLARVYFDQEQYAKAYDIYSTFLLKLDPVEPRDWLEAGWCLYHLKRVPEALGMLYNLESKAAGGLVNLEKYSLRALLYRDQCAVGPADQLVQSFQKEFGDTIQGLKRGRPLAGFRQLVLIEAGSDTDFNQLNSTLSWLKQESLLLPRLSEPVRTLASYLYRSEIGMMTRKIRPYATAALERAAIKLIMMDENLRFLKFAVQRERYNPETPFKGSASSAAAATATETEQKKQIRLRWLQHGDYWRDERSLYQGALPNRCLD